jgi:hypothetical protein
VRAGLGGVRRRDGDRLSWRPPDSCSLFILMSAAFA